MMDLVGKVVATSRPKLKPDFEAVLKCWLPPQPDGKCFGLAKSGHLIEFDPHTAAISRAVKLEEKCTDQLRVLHDHGGGPKIVLILEAGGVQVLARDDHDPQSFQTIWTSRGPLVTLEVEDSLIRGHEDLLIQRSPNDLEIKTFAQKQLQDFQPSASVKNALLVQRSNASQTVSKAQQQVRDLEEAIEAAVSDLTSDTNSLKMKESQFLSRFFDDEQTMHFEAVPKPRLDISEAVGYFRGRNHVLVYKVKNRNNFEVRHVHLLVDQAVDQQEVRIVVADLDLDEICKKLFANDILAEAGLLLLEQRLATTSAKVSIQPHQTVAFFLEIMVTNDRPLPPGRQCEFLKYP